MNQKQEIKVTDALEHIARQLNTLATTIYTVKDAVMAADQKIAELEAKVKDENNSTSKN